jgi:hypothetical protein
MILRLMAGQWFLAPRIGVRFLADQLESDVSLVLRRPSKMLELLSLSLILAEYIFRKFMARTRRWNRLQQVWYEISRSPVQVEKQRRIG